jgi:hypothetical protein
MSMKRIRYAFTIMERKHNVAALFAIILALAGFANADAMSSAHSHKGKKGSLKITTPTEVGGAMLQPGDYEVKEVDSPSGPVVEFVHLFRNELASELVQADEEEVVVQVRFTAQALSSPPKHTELLFAPNTTNAAALEIRGNAIGYLFAPPELAGKADTTVVCTNGAMHE